MRTRKNILAGLFTAIVIAVVVLGCSDDILDKTNPNDLSTDTYFTNEAEIITGVNAVYAAWQGLDLYAREYFFVHDLRGDDMKAGGDQLELQRRQLLEGTHEATNPVMGSVWNGLYRVIHRANIVIELAPREEVDASDEIKERVVGEAKFHRAWAYFELVSMWGGVPLYTTYSKTTGDVQGRATVDEVYNLIVEDLMDAIESLPEEYPDTDIGRATTYAARAMLGRAYMQQGDYSAAHDVLTPIVASGKYSLSDSYIENFREEAEFNEESIFEIAFSNAFGGMGWNAPGDGTNMEVTVRGQEYGPNAWRNLAPSDDLLDEYEDGDPRYDQSFYEEGDEFNNGTSVLANIQGVDPSTSWKKYQLIYKVEAENAASGINFRVIRYAEVLLMLAECENELGNSGEAIDFLNQIRDRQSVMMPNYPTSEYPVSNQQQIFEAIVHEKRIELSGEQIRNRDILRWRAQGKLDGEPISYFQSRHALLPIPQSEIDNNPEIDQSDQNPGY